MNLIKCKQFLVKDFTFCSVILFSEDLILRDFAVWLFCLRLHIFEFLHTGSQTIGFTTSMHDLFTKLKLVPVNFVKSINSHLDRSFRNCERKKETNHKYTGGNPTSFNVQVNFESPKIACSYKLELDLIFSPSNCSLMLQMAIFV